MTLPQVLGAGEGEVARSRPGPQFLGQFPYKSCQRSLTPKKVTGHKWPYNIVPSAAPKRRVSLKRRQTAGARPQILLWRLKIRLGPKLKLWIFLFI